MRLRRPPDWLIYGAVVAGLLAAAVVARRERAPPPAPIAPPAAVEAEGEGALIGPASPLDPAVVVEVASQAQPDAGTAFSVAPSGLWVTARHVVDGCLQAALVVGPGRGVEARVHIDPRGEAALLQTEGGTAPLPLDLTGPLRRGERAFHPGFPQGEPGEATSRLIGRETLVVHGRGARTEPVLVWAEAGRTAGLKGTLGGLSGAPALDAEGRVIGVTIAEAPRRGRIYTTAPETLLRTLAEAPSATRSPVGEAVTPANYGQVADDLRRTLRVAQVVCLRT